MAKKSNKSIRTEVSAKRKAAAKEKARNFKERQAIAQKQIKKAKKPK